MDAMDTSADGSSESHIQSEPPILNTSSTMDAMDTSADGSSEAPHGSEGVLIGQIEGTDPIYSSTVGTESSTDSSAVESAESSADVPSIRQQKESSADVLTARRTPRDIIRSFTDLSSPLVDSIMKCTDNRSLIFYFS